MATVLMSGFQVLFPTFATLRDADIASSRMYQLYGPVTMTFEA
jgi:hypothetical protein